MAIRTLNKFFLMKNEELHKVQIFLIIFIYIAKYVTDHNNKKHGIKKTTRDDQEFHHSLKNISIFLIQSSDN